MRELSITELNDQAEALRARVLGPDRTAPPPFWIWAQSIDLAEHVEPLGAYCREKAHLPRRLRELSVLIVARHNRSPFGWHAHHQHAIEAGVDPDSLQRLSRGDDPKFTHYDEDVAYRFAVAILEKHVVDDELFRETRETLGIEGLVDFIGCLGSFSMSTWGLNVFKLGIDDGTPWPFADTDPF